MFSFNLTGFEMAAMYVNKMVSGDYIYFPFFPVTFREVFFSIKFSAFWDRLNILQFLQYTTILISIFLIAM